MKQAAVSMGNDAGEVLAAIAAMTRQSQWLALNVTLEAARAGESGRQLAQVAERVSELVERMQRSGQRMQACLDDPCADDTEVARCMAQARHTLGEVSAHLRELAVQFRG